LLGATRTKFLMLSKVSEVRVAPMTGMPWEVSARTASCVVVRLSPSPVTAATCWEVAPSMMPAADAHWPAW
jgi:hypothetical protein